MAGFLVPFLSGGLIKSQQIRDEYDENAGNIVDAASAKYNAQFDENKKIIELQNSNFAAVETAFGTVVAEVAAKRGLLNTNTKDVVKEVEADLKPGFIASLQDLNLEGADAIKSQLQLQTLFSDDYAAATKKLKSNRDWAANNLNKGAVKNLTDLYLAKGEKLPEPSGIEKAQKFMFGDRVTEGTGVGFEQAVAGEIGDQVKVQPGAEDSRVSIAEAIGYRETLPSRVETKYAQLNKSLIDRNSLYGQATVNENVAGGFVFNISNDYKDQYNIHTEINNAVESGVLGENKTQGQISNISTNLIQNNIIEPALLLSLSPDKFSETTGYATESGLDKYLNLNKAIKNKNILKDQTIDKIKLDNNLKGFIANTIKNTKEEDVSVYGINSTTYSEFTTKNPNKIDDTHYQNAYGNTVLITAHNIFNQYGANAAEFFLRSLPNVSITTAEGKTVDILSIVTFRLNQLKAKSLNNRG